jgi:hypothetical protein
VQRTTAPEVASRASTTHNSTHIAATLLICPRTCLVIQSAHRRRLVLLLRPLSLLRALRLLRRLLAPRPKLLNLVRWQERRRTQQPLLAPQRLRLVGNSSLRCLLVGFWPPYWGWWRICDCYGWVRTDFLRLMN